LIGLNIHTNTGLIQDHDVLNGRCLSEGEEERPKNTYGDGNRRLRCIKHTPLCFYSLIPSSLTRREYPSPPSHHFPLSISLGAMVPGRRIAQKVFIFPVMDNFCTIYTSSSSSRLFYPCFSFPSSCHSHHTLFLPTSHLLQERRRFTRFASRYSLLLRFYVLPC